MSLPAGLDELLRRIQGRDVVGADPSGEFSGQATRSAPDVEDALALRDPGGIGQSAGQVGGVPAHESVVGVGRSGEQWGRPVLAYR
jgi:hypothetical protein